MNTLQLAKMKQHLLQEIGDASARPYDWDITKETKETREYKFETDSEPATKYIVDLYELEPDPDDETNPGVSLKINFSTADEEGDKDYRSLTNKGELYRVMSTLAEIIKYDIQHRPWIKTIFFEPSRRPDKDTLSQNARANLYIKFITTAFPQIDPRRDIENDYGYISIRLPDRFKKNKLQEKVKGVQWLQKPYFWAAQGHFPLTPNIAKIINGEKAIRVDAFHITSAKNASRLKQLEGSKKSISAMTKVPQYSLEDLSGIHSHGVMFSLEGNILLKSIEDIMSTPDESGRRWINIGLINERIGKQYRQYMSQDSRLDDLRSRLESDYDKKVGTNWNSVYNDKLVDANELSLSKEELREFLTLWISRSMTWIKENLEEFIQALSSKKSGQTQYDEVVVNEIELTGAVVNLADLRGTEEQINKMKQDIEDAVGPDNVVYIDSSNFDRANKQSNRATVTNFIIGNGGKISDRD